MAALLYCALGVSVALGWECEGLLPKICACEEDMGASYEGTLNYTIDGETCMFWKDAPRERFNELPENYCRNANGTDDGIWCYTEGKNWGYCKAPICGCDNYNPSSCGCSTVKQADYRGTVSVSRSGKECQKWSSQTPNKHPYDPDNSMYEDEGLDSNYCRNPLMGSEGAWCYINDGSVRWDYCDIKVCDMTTTTTTTTTPNIPDECKGVVSDICTCKGTKGIYYNGVKNVTKMGKDCRYWKDSIEFTDLPENYCRNPDSSRFPWCFIDSKGKREYCDITECPCDNLDGNKCGCMQSNQIEYRGHIAVTEKGDTCQRWDSQYPNQHIYVPDAPEYINQGLDENYCRNPDGEGTRPWCYLANGGSDRWRYCDIKPCDATW